MKHKPDKKTLAMKRKMERMHKQAIRGIKTYSIQKKALVLLDDVCGPIYYGCELSSELSDEQKDEILRRVYIYAHGANNTNMCYHVHDDYRKRINRDYALCVRNKPIPK